MRGLTAMLLAACCAPTHHSGMSGCVEDLDAPGGGDTGDDSGHRAHFDPMYALPSLSDSWGQTYMEHPHWHGRTHRAWKKRQRRGAKN